MTAQMFEGFDPSKYEEEARRRWGGSPEFEESQRRTKAYAADDWAAIQKEGNEIMNGIVAAMDRGPADPEVQEWIGRHHGQINERFYTCSTETYRCLADMYVQDPRFAAFYEKYKPGMAQFMREAMYAYCDARGGR